MTSAVSTRCHLGLRGTHGGQGRSNLSMCSSHDLLMDFAPRKAGRPSQTNTSGDIQHSGIHQGARMHITAQAVVWLACSVSQRTLSTATTETAEQRLNR